MQDAPEMAHNQWMYVMCLLFFCCCCVCCVLWSMRYLSPILLSVLPPLFFDNIIIVSWLVGALLDRVCIRIALSSSSSPSPPPPSPRTPLTNDHGFGMGKNVSMLPVRVLRLPGIIHFRKHYTNSRNWDVHMHGGLAGRNWIWLRMPPFERQRRTRALQRQGKSDIEKDSAGPEG